MRYPTISVTLLFLLLIQAAPASASAIPGYWRTIDDATGKTKSIVELYEVGETGLEGRVTEILHSDRGPDPLCENCPGKRKGQPIKGMVILWDMDKQAPREYSGGRILDPARGKVYKARLSLREDGKLEVRGFIGIPLLGRTQVWEPLKGEP
ncbi:MAG: DUF2147 domain-containing protein [Oceanipulchritudo sp.]